MESRSTTFGRVFWTPLVGAVVAVFVPGAAPADAGPPGAIGDLYVTSSSTDQVIQYDGITGEPSGVFAHAGISGPTDLAFGPSGDLFVVNWTANTVTRHDALTGALKGVFARNGLDRPNSLVFTGWGTMLISNQTGATIREFDAATGEFLRVFARNIGVGVSGLTIGPNGNVFVSDVFNARVLQYLPDGTLKGVFASGNGLEFAEGLVFRPNGNLYVASVGDYGSAIYVFDAQTGAFIRKITAAMGGLDCPIGLAFNNGGHLLASNWAQAYGMTISEIDVKSDTLIRTISGGGLLAPFGLKIKPEPTVLRPRAVGRR